MTKEEKAADEFAGTTRRVTSALRRIIRAIDLHSRSLVQRVGLTGPQLLLLKELAEGGDATVGELARAVHLSQATVTGVLDRLEAKGLAQRRRSVEDRRKVVVSATAEALGVLADAPPMLQEDFERRFAMLAEWEQTQILASLQRIASLMEAGEMSAGPFLSTGPLDASSEQTGAFLDPSSPLRGRE
jgi:DNA-binding MarR family transcriptional regulator